MSASPEPDPDGLLDRLLDAYRAADEAEAKLSRARKLFHATHTGPALEALRHASEKALAREKDFQEAWKSAQGKLGPSIRGLGSGLGPEDGRGP